MVIATEQVIQAYLTEPQIVLDLYCRVSGKSQEDNTSLDNQEEKGRQFVEDLRAQGRNVVIGMVHREVGSGYNLDRKKLKLMQERYRKGIIQGVIFYKVSRLARTQEFINYLMVEMKVYGCQAFCVHTPLNEDDDDYQLRLFMETFFAERERKEIVTKLSDARERAIREGNYGSSGYKPLYGYEWVKEKRGKKLKKVGYRINEKQAEYVLKAFQAYVDGAKINDIIKMLNEAGDKKWANPNVKRLLTDERYTGTGAKALCYKLRGSKFQHEAIDLPDGTYPEIVPRDLFERVQARRKIYAKEAPKRNGNPGGYLFRNRVYCGVCDHKMICWNSTGGKYVCGQHGDLGHTNSIVAAKVEPDVWAFIEEIAKETPQIKQALEIILATDLKNNTLAKIDEEIQEHTKIIEQYQEDLDKGRVNGDARAFVYGRIAVEQRSVNMLLEMKEKEKADGRIAAQKREFYVNIYKWYEKIEAKTEGELSPEEKQEFFDFIGLRVIINKTKQRKVKRWSIELDQSSTLASMVEGPIAPSG